MKKTLVKVRPLDNSLDDFLERLRDARHLEDIWSVSTKALAQIGFSHVVYLMVRLTAPHDRPVILSTMPDWWMDTHWSPDQLCDDPLFRFCGHLTPRLTGSDYLDIYPAINSGERERVLAAGDIGCRTGFACPINMIGTGRCGGWNFGSSMGRKRFDKIYPKVREKAQLIGLYAHTRMDAIRQEHENETKEGSILSAREQECLSFLAKGSRTSGIANLLGISSATVEFHFKNIKRKLGASTRAEAVAKAIASGQIEMRA